MCGTKHSQVSFLPASTSGSPMRSSSRSRSVRDTVASVESSSGSQSPCSAAASIRSRSWIRSPRNAAAPKAFLCSFGLETSAWTLSRGAHSQVSYVDIAANLQHMRNVKPDIILDTRHFQDPDRWVLPLRHSGRHHKIVKSFMANKHFKPWLKNAKECIMRRLKEDKSLTIATFCRRGKHRSVAGVQILKYLLEAEGFECEVSHLNLNDWCCNLSCLQCSNLPDNLRTALEAVVQHWLRL